MGTAFPLEIPPAPSRHDDSRILRIRQSCRFLETALLHPPLAALRLFPPVCGLVNAALGLPLALQRLTDIAYPLRVRAAGPTSYRRVCQGLSLWDEAGSRYFCQAYVLTKMISFSSFAFGKRIVKRLRESDKSMSSNNLNKKLRLSQPGGRGRPAGVGCPGGGFESEKGRLGGGAGRY